MCIDIWKNIWYNIYRALCLDYQQHGFEIGGNSMAKKVTLDTLEAILNEVDKASYNKSRVISDIQNRDARQIIQDCSDYSLKHGIAGLGIAAGLGVAGAGGGIAAGLGGAAAGGGIAAGGGLAAGGGTIMGIVGGGAAAAEGAAAGAAAGSAVPIVGTLIGAGVGLLVGGLVGGAITAKQKQKRERLYQEAIRKLNGQISALTREVQSLQDKNNKKDAEIARLKYLVGVLSAFWILRLHLLQN